MSAIVPKSIDQTDNDTKILIVVLQKKVLSLLTALILTS